MYEIIKWQAKLISKTRPPKLLFGTRESPPLYPTSVTCSRGSFDICNKKRDGKK